MVVDGLNDLDDAVPTFHVFLLRIFGNDSKFKFRGKTRHLSYKVKCLFLSVALYLPGLIISYREGAGVFSNFLKNPPFLVASVIVGIALLALISFFKKIDRTLERLGETVLLSKGGVVEKEAEVKQFIDEINTEMYERPSIFWYYLDSFGGALIGFALGYFSIISPPWVQSDASFPRVPTPNISILPTLYLYAWCAIVGYVIGVAVWRTAGSIWIIREYCKRFVVYEKIVALSPDKTGGLKMLGDLSLKLDIAVAIPSVVALAYMTEGAIIAIKSDPPQPPLTLFGIFLAITYTIFLAGVFFLPLSPPHNAMLEAKNHALQDIDGMFRKVYSKIREQYFDTERFKYGPLLKDLRELYFIYEQTKKMAVWPLNFGLVSKFLLTSSFPLVGTFVINVILKLLFPD